MLKKNDSEKEDLQAEMPAVPMRLYDARYTLIAAVFLAMALIVFDDVTLWHVWLGLGVMVLAAALPVRSRMIRKRERMLRQTGSQTPVEDVVFASCEALDDPAIVLAPGSIVIYQNHAAIEKFGPIARGSHLSSRLRAPQILELVHEVADDHRTRTIDYVEKVPSERWYKVRIAPMREVARLKGGSELFLLIFRDQSESRRMDRMRTDFIANASHELRTPLASLTGFIETLQGPARNDREAQERFLSIMSEQAGRMTRLVDDLLSLTRLEMKAHMAPTEEVDLVPLIGHVRDTLRPMAEDLDVELRLTAPERPVPVTGDYDELIQVFENLIENACKYGQNGGRVDITIMDPSPAAQGMIDVSVKDYGPGIPSEHVPRLTERFYRVNVETSRSKKGTGLGLAIVKHILTRHRGRLIVNSVLGEGSEFVVRIVRRSS
ncbi:MAG: two-component sensor histidine kinase [Rhizobiaceae bacterium MnEN-MB40S]|nr:MAG: two-component sensor histidine kinase [Rhizobiaceae bacterium MnEN-MB40S]